MLLTLIKTKETRFGVHAILYETNHIWGDKQLAEVYIPLEEVPLELIFRVNISKSGIWLQGHKTQWLWPNREVRKRVEAYLQVIQLRREEVRMEVTNYDPERLPDGTGRAASA